MSNFDSNTDDSFDPLALDPAKAGPYMLKRDMKQSGCHVKLRVGEELHIRVDVSNNYNLEWKDSGSHDKKVIKHLSNGPFTPISASGFVGPKTPGEMTVVYKAVGPGQTSLELAEKPSYGKGPGSGLVWTATITVRK